MALPASVPTGTVIGRYWNRDGSDATGEVVFEALSLAEVPDLPEGVVLPTRVTVTVAGGVLNKQLAAGVYRVLVRLDEYRGSKVIEVAEFETMSLPDAAPLQQLPELYVPVLSVEGILPDATGNVDLPASAGGGSGESGVTDHGDLTGLGGDDHPQYYNQARGDARYVRTTQLDSVKPRIVRHTDTSQATTYPVASTGNVWALFAGPSEQSIEAEVGDDIETYYEFLAQSPDSWGVELVVVTGETPTIQRYMGTRTSSSSFNGNVANYSNGTGFQGRTGRSGFTVTSDDLDGGVVRFRWAIRSVGTGGMYASLNYPLILDLKNNRAPA